MNYEKKYKEAQKWIESIYSELSHEQQMEAEAFFPELKESEDERIRKAILELVRQSYPILEKKNQEQMIAWLEKQEGCEYIKKDWLEHIKQSWYKEGFIDGKYNGGTSKEWTINDAAIFKEIIDFLENGTAKLQHDLTKYANWLKIQFTPIEKQGRQFSVDKLKPKFHEGEWITNGDYTWKIVDVKPLDYILQSQDGDIVDDTISHVDKQFHSFTIQDAKDGDVLVVPPIKGSEHSEQIFIFKEIKDREYVKNAVEFYCRCMDNEFASNERSFMGQSDDYFTPATKEQRDTLEKAMADAGYTFDFEKKKLKKIGQNIEMVEALRTEYEKGRADVIAEMQKPWSEEDERVKSCISMILTDANETRFNDFHTTLADCFAWLKKQGEQNPDDKLEDEEYNGEDYGIDSLYHAQRILEKTLGKVDGYQTDDGILSHQCAITAVKKLYEQKPAEWSEEDENKIDTIISVYRPSPKLVNWLKSLKERYTWKPSDEQISVLSRSLKYINTISQNYCHVLGELLAQLKKLREE